MCNHWEINGIRCETGAELVAAIGADKAHAVNGLYEYIGRTFHNSNGTKYPLTEERVAATCLCHVDPEKMAAEFGGSWGYDPEIDAFIAEPA